MSSSDVSLLQLPEIPMKHIMGYLEFPSILVLRKVCHDLRNFIDDTKPSSRFTVIDVLVKGGFIAVDFFFPSSFYIRYNRNEEGCFVTSSFIKIGRKVDDNFVTAFCKDLNFVLGHQKTVLEVFKIRFDQFDYDLNGRILEGVKKSLKSMNKPLQVKSLDLGVNKPNELLSILPYIDPKPVKRIAILERLGKGSARLNYDEIGQLEQWKQAEELEIERYQLPKLCQSFKQFSKITFRVSLIEGLILILIKGLFFGSSTLNEMIIDCYYNRKAVIEQGLTEEFGQPLLDQKENWFFRIPDTNQFLRITFPKNSIVNIKRIEQSDVPRNARIARIE